jgi:flagellum-specific peptidoglycan hydrolase FlgJ
LAQACLESADFSSDVFHRDNNMFGMMHPRVRQTTSLGADAHGYARYRSPLDSLRDYFLYLENAKLLTTLALEAQLAAGRYASDPRYSAKVEAKARELDPVLVNPASFSVATGAAAAAALIAYNTLKSK